MIFIVLNVLLNGLILGLIFSIGGSLFRQSLTFNEWMLVGYVMSAILTVIGYTKSAGNIVSLFIPGRMPSGREIDHIEPLLKEVIADVNKHFGTIYSYCDFKIRMTDSKIANAFALGYNTIIINSGCLEVFDCAQFKAILAHEMAHLYYRDSVHSIALIFGSFGTRVITWIYAGILIVQSMISSMSSAIKNGAIIRLLSFLPFIILLPIFTANWVCTKVFLLFNMMLLKKAEYRADAFAASLGYRNDMIEALEILRHVSVEDNSFMGKLMSAHPPVMGRIGALEDKDIQKQYFGVFQSGIGVANTGVSTNNKKELLLLISYLAFVGVVLFATASYKPNYNLIKPHALTTIKLG